MNHIMKFLSVIFVFLYASVAHAEISSKAQPPSNEDLYRMILEVKQQQAKLTSELKLSKDRETQLTQELKETKAELLLAKERKVESPIATESNAIVKNNLLPEGWNVSAGGVALSPNVASVGGSNQISEYFSGFQVSVNKQLSNNWNWKTSYQNISSGSSFYHSALVSLSSNDNYSLKYNKLDTEIGKSFTLTDDLMLNISGGIRYLSLSETYTPGQLSCAPGCGSTVNSSWGGTKWGVGPKMAINPIWHPFSNGFRLIGGFGISTLVGSNKRVLQRMMWGDTSANTSNYLTVIDGKAGIGYTLQTGLTDIDFETGYQIENWLTNSELYPSYQGSHGGYGSVGVKF